MQKVWVGHSETLFAFAEAHYTPSKGLPERPHCVLNVYYISPAIRDHLSKKQMVGVTTGVKNDVGYSFGLNEIQGKWRVQGDDFRTFLHDFVATQPQGSFSAGFNL